MTTYISGSVFCLFFFCFFPSHDSMCAIDSMGGGARGTRFTGNANSLVEYLTNVISIIISAQGFQCRLKGSQHQYGKCHQVFT